MDAARVILERDGVAALTMRRLAEAVDATPMALYGHVASKDELLVLVLDAEARELDWPRLPDAPRDRIVAVTLFIRDVLAERLWALEAIRPGERFALGALPLAEEIIGGFVRCGLPPEASAHAYRSLWFLITGELRQRVSAAEPRLEPLRRLEIDAERFPNVAGLVDRWEAVERDYDLAHAVGVFVDGLIGARGG